MKVIRKTSLGVMLVLFSLLSSVSWLQVNAQDENPVSWSFSINKAEDGSHQLISTATIEEGWHLYSQNQPGDSDEGPLPTLFILDAGENVEMDGTAMEKDAIIHHDPVFDMEVSYFENEAVFTINAKATGDPAIVGGEISYMVCNETMCMPPTSVFFKFDLVAGTAREASLSEDESVQEIEAASIVPDLPLVDLNNPVNDCGTEKQEEEKKGLFTIFILGFLGGLFALLTPCVFPMIPLTVSFFTKGSQDKRKGMFRAIMYGFFIFLIYILLSTPFHIWDLDPEVLNEVSTSITLNLVFFIIFVVFAISFFGYFEITLPAKWSNKMDSASNVGGMIGIFFMALTLALVSFSCTGPILGSVLAGTLTEGAMPLTVAMGGFGVALGLPFALFAMFPGWLNSLPKSGGWLNSVKVVLGFLELALALKFLSNADLVDQWGLLKRETFFLIWILIGLGLTLYLFGKIKFPHDSPIQKLSKFRITLGILVAAFVLYLAPGVTNTTYANVSLVSGFPPPLFYSWYEKDTKCPLGIDCSKDWEEGVAKAKEKGKPILLDFTGWACVNCRKMEENVWPEDEIFDIINEKYQLISLYVDDKRELPAELQGVIKIDYGGGKIKEKPIKTIGNKWATFQALTFKAVTQPYYVLLSPDGHLLNNPVGYTPNVEEYRQFLECGLQAYDQLMAGDVDLTVDTTSNEETNDMPMFEDPVAWSFSTNKVDDETYELIVKATIEEGWHVYSQHLPSDEGPLPTFFSFEANDNYALEGDVMESEFVTHYDPNFEMDLNYFENEVTFTQTIKVTGATPFKVTGFLNFMVCDESKCLPPEDVNFEFEIAP